MKYDATLFRERLYFLWTIAIVNILSFDYSKVPSKF